MMLCKLGWQAGHFITAKEILHLARGMGLYLQKAGFYLGKQCLPGGC